MNYAFRARSPIGALLLLMAVCALALLPAGATAEVGGQQFTLGGWQLIEYIQPQPGCTGVGYDKRILSRSDCGFGRVALSPAVAGKTVKVDLVDADGTVVDTQTVVTSATGQAQFEVVPDGTWDPGTITVRASVASPDSGSASTEFSLNPLEATVDASDATYAPGEAVVVTGTVEELDTVACCTDRRTAVPARVTGTLADAAGHTLGQPVVTTATADGTYSLTFPGAATQGLHGTPESDFRLNLGVRVQADYTDATPFVGFGVPPTAQTSGRWSGGGSGAVVVVTPPSTLLVRNLFVSSVGWVKPGQRYPFRIVVENHTDHAFTNARVTIPAPDGATFVGASPLGGAGNATATASTVTWTIPNVPAATADAPTTRTLVVDATAKTLSADRKLVWKDLSSTAALTYDGATGAALTAKSHGPKVIPPTGGFETARYGDKPFPVVPVDYRDRPHETRHSGDALARKINSPDVPGSTFNLYQEMSYGQLFPYGDVPSAGIATAGFDYEPGFSFSEPVLVRPDNTPGTCRGTTLGQETTKSLWGSALYPERIHDGWYQLPGDTEYYGGDWPAFTATSAPPAQLDSACGPIGKGVFDAAQIADPEIDYNTFDSDKDGVVDFFMMVFVGLGGNGDSQINGTPTYDNIWPHSSSLEYYFHDPVTGLPGYTTDDQLTDLEGRPQCWRTTAYAESATCGSGGDPALPTYVRVGPYNVNPENAIDFASVISHEYGHHLGLPDFYSTGYSAYNDWNLMAGDYSQHMTVFGKQDLGWVVPRFLQPGESVTVDNWKEIKSDTGRIDWQTPTGEPYTLATANGDKGIHNGQSYGLKLPGRVVLPASAVPDGQYVWWSERGNDFGCTPEAGHNLDIALPGLEGLAPGTPVKLSFKSRFDIEWDFDYGFTLVTTNGTDYTSLPSAKGFTTSMAQNPNQSSCLARLDNGLTGTSASYAAGTQAADRLTAKYATNQLFVDDEYDLSAYAGESGVVLRFSYSTDPGLDRPGWFIDDLKVTAGADVVYSSSFETPDELTQLPGGCGAGGIRTADRCTAGWTRLQGGSRSAQDHGYYLELRDRAGFDFDSHGEADRGAIGWSPGVLVEYTDEVRGYGNNGGSQPPRQHYLDSQPQPGYDCGDNLYETEPEPAPLTDPRCQDAAFTAVAGDSHFRDLGWVDNFTDDSSTDGLWHFDFDCLTLDVTGMSGDTGNSGALPADLTASARITAGAGCAAYDYGRGQAANTAPSAVGVAKPATATVGEPVVLDGSGSSDDRQAPEELTYAWDTDGNGSDDATGQVVTRTYATAGQYTVRLRVTDADGASDTATTVVTVKAAPSDLQVVAMTAGGSGKKKEGDKVTVTVTVKNTGSGPAAASSTKLADGEAVVGTVATPSLAPGASTDVQFTWNLKGVKGERVLRATADSANVLTEASETNNTGTLTVTVKGNKVQNGSFEQPSSSGSAPDGWTGQSTPAGQASWSDGGSDGAKGASTSGSGGNAALLGVPTWTSAPIAVTPGELLDLSVAVRSVGASSAPSVGLAYLGASGALVKTVTALTAPLTTDGFKDLSSQVTVPAGVAQVRIVLSGFSLLDGATRGAVTFDDVRLFSQ